MQNDPQCPFLPLGLTLDAVEDAFQRAHAHATAPRATATAPPICPGPCPDTSEPIAEHDEPMLDGVELLRAAREPIEWLLTLAHRLAAGEPEEIAAIDRLRAAFHARLAGRAIGVRRSDVLVGFALLVGALDPGVVLEGVTRTIADGVSTLLTYEGFALAAQIVRTAERMPAAIHPSREPRHTRGRKPRITRTNGRLS